MLIQKKKKKSIDSNRYKLHYLLKCLIVLKLTYDLFAGQK